MMLNFHLLFTFFLSPLLFGVINRTKAFFAGRQGPPLLQPYFDLYKLIQKGAVYSKTTTFLFRVGPLVSIAASLIAALLIPFGGEPSLLHFSGDILFLAALFGLIRFFMITSALDAGSSFEGMGTSREACFSVLIEPALLITLASLAKLKGSLTLSSIYSGYSSVSLFENGGVALFLAIAALMIIFLFENARIPFDDPNTHLELTMIHEVMILDHSGVDLAFLQYGSMMKMWLLGSLLTGLMPLFSHISGLNLLISIGEIFVLAIIVGIIESIMARLKLRKIPELILGAVTFAILAFIIV